MKRYFIALTCCASIILCACARPKIVIAHRFTKGETLRYLTSVRGEGATNVSGLPGYSTGTEMPIKLVMDLTYGIFVRDVDEKGNGDLELTFRSFTATTEAGGLKIHFESDENGLRLTQDGKQIKDSPGIEGIKEIFKNPTRLTMSPRGKILSMTAAANTAAFLPQADLQSIFREGLFLLPDGPVAPGDSWKEKREILKEALAGIFPETESLKLDINYRLSKVQVKDGNRLADIALSGMVDAAGIEVSAPALKTPGASMKTVIEKLSQKVSGNLLFDVKRGCPRQSRIEILQDITSSTTMRKDEKSTTIRTTTRMKISAEGKLLR